jgi:hypothetical protein
MRVQVVFAAVVCSSTILASARCSATDLPEARPADLDVRLTYSAGMLPEGYEFDVSATRGEVVQHGQAVGGMRNVTLATCATSSEDLDALYRVLRDNRFDQIETYEQEVYDRGGFTLSVGFGSRTITVADGGRTFIQHDWDDQWSAVTGAVEVLMAQCSAAATVHLPVVMDGGAMATDLMVTLDGASAFPYGQGLELWATPGPHELTVSAHYDSATAVSATVDFQPGRTVHLGTNAQGALSVTVEP